VGSPPTGALNTCGYTTFDIFDKYGYMWETIQDRAIVTMLKSRALPNHYIIDDLE